MEVEVESSPMENVKETSIRLLNQSFKLAAGEIGRARNTILKNPEKSPAEVLQELGSDASPFVAYFTELSELLSDTCPSLAVQFMQDVPYEIHEDGSVTIIEE